MCIFVAYYIAETNTINIFTNKTKTIMKYKLLRFSLLSVLVMLCGGAFALMAQAGDEHTAVVDLANFEKADNGYDVAKAGTSGTGGEMEITTSDISLTSSLGYAKKSEMSIYKNGSLTISLKEGNETKYWILLPHRTGYITDDEFSSLLADC